VQNKATLDDGLIAQIATYEKLKWALANSECNRVTGVRAVADDLAARAMSLPMHTDLDAATRDKIATTLCAALA